MITNQLKVCFIVGTFMTGAWGYSAQVPESLASDARIQQVVFNRDNVVKVQGNALVTTQLIFANDEVIKNVQNGDAAGWAASINPELPNMIFLKPVVKDSDTNMTVVTNHHVYYFELDSTVKPGISPTYAIKFVYPEETLSEAEQEIALKMEDKNLTLSVFQDPSKFNWDYSFNGDKLILPLHVFDDGKFTYLQLAPNQPVPAVFMIDNAQGKEAVVNVRMEGHYVVIQQVAPQWTLRWGENHVVSLFNNKRIAAIRGRHS